MPEPPDFRSIRPAQDDGCDNKHPYRAYCSIGGAGEGGCDEDPLDLAIGRLATAQGGVVSTAQLRSLGAGRGEVQWRLRHGRLVPKHRGVYAVGHEALGPRGRRFAALLAAGPGAVLSHRSAAAAWVLLPEPEHAVELTVAGRRARDRPGISIHFATHLAPTDLTQRNGLPLTAPFRTLLDLATTVSSAELHRATAEAQVLRLLTSRAIETSLDKAARRPGAARLAAALGAGDAAPTRNRLERTFLRLVRTAGLPRPHVNARIGRFECDFAWPDHRVVVEVDGWAAHGHREAFERDRARDAELQALGYVVVRFTWRQVTGEPLLVAGRLGQLLAGAREPLSRAAGSRVEGAPRAVVRRDGI